jgi:hypothetical protein
METQWLEVQVEAHRKSHFFDITAFIPARK